MSMPMTGNRGAAGSAQQGNATGDIIPKGYRKGQIQQFTPEQTQLFQRLFSNVSPDSYLSRLAAGDEQAFQQMEEPAWRAFGEAQGQLGSRFSQLAPGAMSALRGSGFKNAAGQLGSDFASQLAARRHALQMSALQQMQDISGSLLNQRPYEQFLSKKPEQSMWQKLIAGGAPIVGGALGAAFGGPAGAVLGAGLGSAVGSGFSGRDSGNFDFASAASLPKSWKEF